MKRELIQFRYYDYVGIQDHLKHMAREGWQLKEAGNFFWKYESLPPEDMNYCIQYKDEDISMMASYAGDETLENAAASKASDSGWTLVDTWSNLRIYSSRNMSAEPLEKDDRERFEKIKGITKKTFSAPMVILLVCMAYFVYSDLSEIIKYPLNNLNGYSSLISLFMVISAIIILAYSIIQTYSWLKRSEQSIAAGGMCVDARTRQYQIVNNFIYVFVAIALLAFVASEISELGASGGMMTISYIILITVLIAFDIWINNRLKKKKASKTKLILANIGVFFLIFASMMAFVFIGVTKGINEDDTGNATASMLPLTLEDLEFDSFEDETYYLENSSSFLLSRVYAEDSIASESGYEIIYYAVKVKNPKHYDWFFKKALMEDVYDFSFLGPLDIQDFWKEVDASSWGADKAFRSFDEDVYYDKWILGKDNYIISVWGDFDISDNQKKMIVDKLISAVQ